MTDAPRGDPSALPLLPSLGVVRAELDVERASNERRADSVDTKAGLVLGAAGLLVGLGFGNADPSLLVLVAQALAAAAGAFAIAAFVPRYAGAVSPRALREEFITAPEAATQLAVLDTRIEIQEQDERRLASKFVRLRCAIWSLACSVLVALAGVILEYVS